MIDQMVVERNIYCSLSATKRSASKISYIVHITN